MVKRKVFVGAVARLVGVCSLICAVPSAVSAGGVYFVKQGDTLSELSKIFGVEASRIRRENRLAGNTIKAGDRLRIPDAEFSVPLGPSPAPSLALAGPDRVTQLLCREERVYHAVAKGETLSALSRRYGTPLDALLRLNGLKKTSRLSIGQRVIVRRSGPKTHVVLRGETLGRIAARYQLAVDQLAQLNGLRGDRLATGQRLQVEACESTAAVPTAPPQSGTVAAEQSDAALAALAEAAAEAQVEARDREYATLLSAPTAGIAPLGEERIGNRVINLAKTMLDIPYRFGGTTLRGIDCSAYVQRVFGLLDIGLPRTAREQYDVGASIDREELSVGDLVFFRTYASFPSHVGIYLGDNLFIHASSVVRKVTINSLDRPYYTKRFIGGRRLVDDGASTAQIASAPQ